MNKSNTKTQIPKWARKLHDECCSWACPDERIAVNPKCRTCGKVEPKSVAHKGENILCNADWNDALRKAVY